MRILLSGYYGFGNVGDEAILAAIVEQLRSLPAAPDIEVLSARPEQTAATYAVDACDRWRPTAVAAAMRRCALLVQGGGGLIQDVTSRLSPAYYLGTLALARLFRRPCVIFAQGLGPLRSRLWRRLTVALFASARAVVVRDAASAAALGAWGLRREVITAADPALLLHPASSDQAARWAAGHGFALPERYCILVPRAIPGARQLAASALDVLRPIAAEVVVLPFQPADEPLARELAASAGAIALPAPADPRVAARLVADACAVVSLRLHALIFAAASLRPALAVAHDPKLSEFCGAVGYTAVAADPAGGGVALRPGDIRPPDPAAVACLTARARHAFDVLGETISELGS